MSQAWTDKSLKQNKVWPQSLRLPGFKASLQLRSSNPGALRMAYPPTRSRSHHFSLLPDRSCHGLNSCAFGSCIRLASGIVLLFCRDKHMRLVYQQNERIRNRNNVNCRSHKAFMNQKLDACVQQAALKDDDRNKARFKHFGTHETTLKSKVQDKTARVRGAKCN